jgi:hypothetical protein
MKHVVLFPGLRKVLPEPALHGAVRGSHNCSCDSGQIWENKGKPTHTHVREQNLSSSLPLVLWQNFSDTISACLHLKIYLWPGPMRSGMCAAGRTVETVMYLAGFSNVKSKVCFCCSTHSSTYHSICICNMLTLWLYFADHWIEKPT